MRRRCRGGGVDPDTEVYSVTWGAIFSPATTVLQRRGDMSTRTAARSAPTRAAAPAQPALPIRALAEFLGTALLVIGGVGTASPPPRPALSASRWPSA